jgi:formate-dependent nitrite reductase membrane component NrfD
MAENPDDAVDESRAEKVEFWLVYAAMFVLSIASELVALLFPWRWVGKSKLNRKTSVIERARKYSSTHAGLAFMG